MGIDAVTPREAWEAFQSGAEPAEIPAQLLTSGPVAELTAEN
jgi:hypothetical protein